MANPRLDVPPVLSTPESHIFEDPTPVVDVSKLPRLSDEQLAVTYEIERTVRDIREGRWRRVALQFPDEMLVDAPRVYERLRRGLWDRKRKIKSENVGEGKAQEVETEIGGNGSTLGKAVEELSLEGKKEEELEEEVKICILADTSYGACCVDEIAAEHVDAEVVVHYGRSCLSPTARLPVIYVFTSRPLDMAQTVNAFKGTYPEREDKVVLMADIPYCSHLPAVHKKLQEEGYTHVYATEVVHNPSSPLPNRTTPKDVNENATQLQDYKLFHVAQPPTALLLTLSSRVSSIHIFDPATTNPTALPASSAALLRRRYALLTTLSTVSIYGILINTLSVRNYMDILSHVQAQITAAGKKYYTFVVGKINAAKIANFAEIGGWVVIGCWESSLVESREFWRPVITPFELGIALMTDGERVWTGEWWSDFERILGAKDKAVDGRGEGHGTTKDVEVSDEEDDAPPEFDLRTGRYVSHSRPMQSRSIKPDSSTSPGEQEAPNSLIRRANGDIAQVGGVVSPGAEFLRSNRTWQGLGSDFEIAYQEDGGLIEEGRSGVARGYTDGTESSRR